MLMWWNLLFTLQMHHCMSFQYLNNFSEIFSIEFIEKDWLMFAFARGEKAFAISGKCNGFTLLLILEIYVTKYWILQ